MIAAFHYTEDDIDNEQIMSNLNYYKLSENDNESMRLKESYMTELANKP